ncbi:hypothetical protein [Baekduia sp.]|jgi:hypothetical protein|uniref:hypothetical protein n=1 Tax=Baekduia sp. TaxID=2600305 RepID=UPI002DFEA493|nr:hypothetical protein [Baekduia sp.]
MEGVAVDLDDEVVVREAKIPLGAVVDAVDVRPWEAVIEAELQERGLDVAACARDSVVLEIGDQVDELTPPGLPRVGRERPGHGVKIEELELLSALDGAP